MTRRAILGVAAVVLAPFACAKEEGPPTRGEARDFSAVCDKSNDGKRVAVEGYLRFPDSFHQKLSIVLRLYRSADFGGAPMGVQTPLGSQPNHVEYVGQKFNDKDLRVHAADGQVVGYGTKARVSGTVYFPMAAQEFACALSNPWWRRPGRPAGTQPYDSRVIWSGFTPIDR